MNLMRKDRRERERANISEAPIAGWDRKYRKIHLQYQKNHPQNSHELEIFNEKLNSNKEP